MTSEGDLIDEVVFDDRRDGRQEVEALEGDGSEWYAGVLGVPRAMPTSGKQSRKTVEGSWGYVQMINMMRLSDPFCTG
jgi:hypothetical protein